MVVTAKAVDIEPSVLYSLLWRELFRQFMIPLIVSSVKGKSRHSWRENSFTALCPESSRIGEKEDQQVSAKNSVKISQSQKV